MSPTWVAVLWIAGAIASWPVIYRFAYRVRMSLYPSLEWAPSDRFFCSFVSSSACLLWPFIFVVAGVVTAVRPVAKAIEKSEATR